MATLHHRIGGDEAIYATIALMYEKILSDDRISWFFDNTDINKLRKMNSQFVSLAFKNPQKYEPEYLRKAHQKLVENGLNDTHFDIVLAHLKAAMNELNVDPLAIDEGISLVESLRPDVLNK